MFEDERTTERFIEWRNRPPAHKTAWVTAVLLAVLLAVWLWTRSLMQSGPIIPLVGCASLAGFCALLLVLAICALAVRRGWKAWWAPWLPAVLCSSYIAVMVVLDGGLSPFLAWLLLAGTIAAICFDEWVGTGVVVLGFGFIMLFVVAPLMPELVSSVGDDAALRTLGLLGMTQLALVTTLLLGLVLDAHRLMETRLKRSHDLLRRYVPAQLADRILAGGHDAVAKHERRKLTIVFTDVAGFTGLSDELDAEELATVLSEYLSEMTALADGFGATVNQLVGDGIMIFFGAPVERNERDDALAAVRMASAMQQRMAELRERWFRRGMQRPFHVRIGINTGFASVGDFGSQGRMMYSAIGQQTNLAARIQAHCKPDRVLMSHSTWALVQDAIPCSPQGEITVKGLHYPVLVYEVSGAAQRAA